jgi:glycosyltransferase involved in cell wall biosynthesis
MNILYLSQYFPPEAGATQTRAYEMARNWVRLGHQVTMLTEIPNHPAGIIPPAYHGKLYERSDLEGIDVIRVWVKTSPIKNFRNRLLFYLTYLANATFAGLLLRSGWSRTLGRPGGFDLIYATSPPLFVGGAALALSHLQRIPMVFEVRDLWPESAVALGELSNRHAIAWATRLEESCYRRANGIVVVTDGIRSALEDRGIPGDKLLLVPNGANIELFQFRPEGRQRIRAELGMQDAFIAIYAGIHGVAQGLETIAQAANRLRDRPQIHFLLVGDGPEKARIAALAADYGLSNLTLIPEQPRDKMPDYLSSADVALVPLRNVPLFHGARPSKMFDAWSCERPLLLSIDGEARRTMEQARGGIFVPPEDPDAMAQAILHLQECPAKRIQMGANGRSYTETHFSRRRLAEELIIKLEELT